MSGVRLRRIFGSSWDSWKGDSSESPDRHSVRHLYSLLGLQASDLENQEELFMCKKETTSCSHVAGALSGGVCVCVRAYRGRDLGSEGGGSTVFH